MEKKLLLRVPETAEALGISRSKAYEMIAAGELPSIRVRDSIRVPYDDLLAWITDKKEAARAGELGAAFLGGVRNEQSRVPR